jgi:hypothetical protein
MTTTTVTTLDGSITTADSGWPVLSYDDQVTPGTMVLWDPSLAAQWPTGAIGGAVAAGSIWKNLGENFPDGVQDAGATLPVYDVTGMRVSNASSSIEYPAGQFDLAALGWPNFHATLWGKTPAAPIASLSQLIAGFGPLTDTMTWGFIAAYGSGDPTLGVIPTISGSQSSQPVILNLNSFFAMSMTCVDAGGGQRRLRTYVNNVLAKDATVTPGVAAQPTERLKIGKGTTVYSPFTGGLISRLIAENCTVSGRDPEAARAAEWTAKHAAHGL